MQVRGTTQRQLVEETTQEFWWIESGSQLREFWSAVEYGSSPKFLSRIKNRGYASMAKFGQDIFKLLKWKTKISQLIIKLDVMTVEMDIGNVPELAVVNECQRSCYFMKSGTTWHTCGATSHRAGHAGKSSNRNYKCCMKSGFLE